MQSAGKGDFPFASIREANPPCADSIGYPPSQRCCAEKRKQYGQTMLLKESGCKKQAVTL